MGLVVSKDSLIERKRLTQEAYTQEVFDQLILNFQKLMFQEGYIPGSYNLSLADFDKRDSKFKCEDKRLQYIGQSMAEHLFGFPTYARRHGQGVSIEHVHDTYKKYFTPWKDFAEFKKMKFPVFTFICTRNKKLLRYWYKLL